jgi:hypothetical protein
MKRHYLPVLALVTVTLIAWAPSAQAQDENRGYGGQYSQYDQGYRQSTSQPSYSYGQGYYDQRSQGNDQRSYGQRPTGSNEPAYYGGYYDNRGDWYYDYYGNRPRSQSEGQWSDESSGSRGREFQELNGRVLRTKRVRVEGTDTDILAALVETDSGRRIIVDLGPTEDLRNEGVRISQGDRIWCRGPFFRVRDQRVMMAFHVRANEETARIDRRRQFDLPRLEREERMLEPSMQGRSDMEDRYGRGERQSGYYRDRGNEYGRSEESENEYGRGEGRPDEERMGGQGRLAWQRVHGNVTQTREIELPGMEDRMMVGMVKTDQGQQSLVCFGPREDLENVQISQGQPLTIEGPVFHIGGKKLVLAQRLRADGQTVDINQQFRPEKQGNSQQVRAQIMETRQIELPGISKQLMVALVKSDQGRNFLVCLGPADRLGDLRLRQGEQISTQGPCFRFEGHRFVMARQVNANGQTIQVSWGGSQDTD